MIRNVYIVLALVGLSLAASAQPVSVVPYAPVTLDEKQYSAIMSVFSEMKYKDAVSLVNFFQQLEQKAQADAAKEKQAK